MSRSTKLASASYILSFVASRAPDLVTSDTIANAVQDHPTRVRQLISTLVKADLVHSIRGANGGVVLAREPGQITLRQVYEAVEDQAMVSMPQKGGYRGWGPGCHVHDVLTGLYDDVEAHFRRRLGAITIEDLYNASTSGE